jgi:UDP-2,3-diacylglucosamine pyrophosphatase LpxH
MKNLLLFWKKRKGRAKRASRRRLRKAPVRQHVGSSNRQVGDALGDIYRQLNEMTILLSNHDHFLREDHHKNGLVRLAKFLSENFYKLSTADQRRIKQNIEFIQTDKYILSVLANSRRLRVVEILSAIKDKNIKNRQYVSERVNRLVEAGILERVRVGKRVYYSKINNEHVVGNVSGDKQDGE